MKSNIKIVMILQEAHPIRLKQIHVLNIPSFLDRCLALVRPFMKSEVASLVNQTLTKFRFKQTI